LSAEKQEESPKGMTARLASWFDSRLGLSYQFLRPVPEYSLNPFYWLGALAVVAFVIEAITGMIMAIYYVPNPTQAYPSTQYIFQNVSYGTFLETVHLYTAYAMIFLAVAHLMRGYFVSIQKQPREAMWVVGMLMGFITLGMGFTGYLLPWTVVSKSATDVGLGLIAVLPPGVVNFLDFLLVGAGGDSTVLLRFFDLHVLVLPAALLVLLVVKMYMLEAHGVSEPTGGLKSKPKLIPIFPDVSFYLLELAALFGSAMLLISVVFPVNLPAEFTPQAAASLTVQPEWYFLWMYQILKLQVFEGPGLPYAMAVITLIFALFVLLPFFDRGKTRSLRNRRTYITIGVIFIAEIVVLSIWGQLTPGAVIPNEQGALVIGGTAILVALGSAAVFKVLYRGFGSRLNKSAQGVEIPSKTGSAWTAAVFAGLCGWGALSIGSAVNVFGAAFSNGWSAGLAMTAAFSAASIALVGLSTMYLIYRLDLGSGRIRKRVRSFEVGWEQ